METVVEVASRATAGVAAVKVWGSIAEGDPKALVLAIERGPKALEPAATEGKAKV